MSVKDGWWREECEDCPAGPVCREEIADEDIISGRVLKALVACLKGELRGAYPDPNY